MLKIGLTGGIACGKSTIADTLRGIGVPVLDADQVARDVVAIGSVGLQKIVDFFGTKVLLTDGSLNREALRGLILQDLSAKKQLETITHPLIFQSMQEWQHQQEIEGATVTVIEAALMVETGSYRMYDGIIVASCSRHIQEKRLIERNNISQSEAQRWIASQMSLTEKEKVADWVIQNDHSLQTLQGTVVENWTQFVHTIQQKQTTV